MIIDRISYESDSIRLTVNQRQEIINFQREFNVSFASVVRSLVAKGLESLQENRIESDSIKKQI